MGKYVSFDNLSRYDGKIKEYIEEHSGGSGGYKVGTLMAYDYHTAETALVLENLKPGVYILYTNGSFDIHFKALESSSGTQYIHVNKSNDKLILILTQVPVVGLGDWDILGAIITNSIGFSNSAVYTTNYMLYYKTSDNGNMSFETVQSKTSATIADIDTAQTISGKKTFGTLPESSEVPTTDDQLTNKKYVDDTVSNIGDVNQYFITGNSSSNPFIFKGKKKGVYHFIDKKPGDNIYYKFDTSDSNTSDPLVPLEINILKDINGTEANGTPLGYYTKAGMSFRPFSSVYCVEIKRGTSSSTGLSTGIPSNGSIQYVTVEHQQTISSEKTFSTLPKSTVVPTNDAHLVNKKYVDDTVIQKSTMPTASSTNLGAIVQYIGTTDSTYTNGYFYKCVSDGEETPTYSWQNISVQSGGSGQSSITQDTYIKDLSPGVYLCTKSYNLYLGSSTTRYIGGYGLLEVSAGSNNAINFTFTTNDGRYYYVNADSELNAGNITTGTIITGVVQSNGNYTVYSRTALGTLIDRSENTSSNLCRVYVGHKAPTVSSSEVVTTTIKNYTITTTYVEPNTYSLSIASSRAAQDVAMAISHGIGLIRVGNLAANTPKTYTINVSDDDDIDIWVYEHFGDFRPEVSLTGNYDDLINKPVTYLGKTTDYDSNTERLDISTLKQNTVYAIWYNHSIGNTDRSLYVTVPINGTTYNYDFIINGRYFGSDIALADGMFIYLVVTADLSTTISTGPIFYAFEQFNSINLTRTIYFNGSGLTHSSVNYNRGIVNDLLDQTISGVKTFNSFPLVSGTPTLNNELINKGFADTTYASKSDLSSLITYGTTDLSPGDTLPDGTLYIVYDNN